jgi:hypothetical protein
VALLSDPEIATVEAWLADLPEIEIVSRDRGGGHRGAEARARPQAIQVADRWHLMENASAHWSSSNGLEGSNMGAAKILTSSPGEKQSRGGLPPFSLYRTLTPVAGMSGMTSFWTHQFKSACRRDSNLSLTVLG